MPSDCGTVTITAGFDPSLVEAVGCNVDPRQLPLDADPGTVIEGTVTVQNPNLDPVEVAIDWTVDGQFLTTNPTLSGGFGIPAEGQDFITVPLPFIGDWPVGEGEHNVQAEVSDVVEVTAAAPVRAPARSNGHSEYQGPISHAPVAHGCGCGSSASVVQRDPSSLLAD